MKLQYGDTVKIRRGALKGDQQSFPQGYYIRHTDNGQVEVELMYFEERVVLAEKDVEFLKKAKLPK